MGLLELSGYAEMGPGLRSKFGVNAAAWGPALGRAALKTPAVDFKADPYANVSIPTKPTERPFALKNDSCLEYLTPANMTSPLVYEDELIYSTAADGTKTASWVQKQSLRLPIFCRVCKTDDGKGSSHEREEEREKFSEKRQATDKKGLPDIGPAVVYLGS